MPSNEKGRAFTVGSPIFDPSMLFEQWSNKALHPPGPSHNLETSIKSAFALNDSDAYVYHATVATTLAQVQQVVNAGSKNGLHAWYKDPGGNPNGPPLTADIDAYTSVFLSTTATDKALTALEKNAKKESIRARVAQNLVAKRLFPAAIKVPKLKKAHTNPYLDFWIWSCHNLEWAGPEVSTAAIKHSHHILPIFYHHFGCVCPTFESLETIKSLAAGRQIYEIGSGNGYWTLMLRRHGLTVTAVDNGDSLWRTMWIPDTVKAEGARFLEKHKGGHDAVLMLIYPQVTTAFTASVLRAYQGDTICVAGTQNANGFTGFQDTTIDQYMEQHHGEYKKIVQTPLPSFAGKDEALFVFSRRKAS